MSEPEKIRAFVALRMSPEVEDAVVRLIESMRYSRVSWVRRANLHLTLRFLGGAVEQRLIPLFDAALSEVAARTSPFILSVQGTGAFPDLNRPRVVWVGLLGEELPLLAERVEAAAVQCGFAAERRGYSPHLTIGRVRDLRDWRPVRGLLVQASQHDFGSTRISEMMLYRSILGREAARYQELARYQLGGSAREP